MLVIVLYMITLRYGWTKMTKIQIVPRIGDIVIVNYKYMVADQESSQFVDYIFKHVAFAGAISSWRYCSTKPSLSSVVVTFGTVQFNFSVIELIWTGLNIGSENPHYVEVNYL